MKLQKNMGIFDRIIRSVIAIVIAVLYFTGRISGLTAIILAVVAIIFIVTSFVSFCTLYTPFGLSTRKKEKNV